MKIEEDEGQQLLKKLLPAKGWALGPPEGSSEPQQQAELAHLLLQQVPMHDVWQQS